jgi:hypothetical protein
MRAEIEDNQILTAYEAIWCAAGGWFKLLLPLVTGVLIVPYFRIERTSGFLRYEIMRMGKKSYYLTKFVVSFMVGMLVMMAGMLLYGILVFALLPHGSSLSGSEQKDLVLYVLGLVTYGGVWGVFSLGIMGFVQNQYIGICIPFLLKYMYDQSYTKYYDGYEENSFFQPDGLIQIASGNSNVKATFGFYILLCAVTAICFVIGMQMRRDVGE